MAIVKQLDKRSGLTYVYESKSVWDKELKQSRSTRRLIGRLDPNTGDVIETDGRRRGGKPLGETSVPVKEAPNKHIAIQQIIPVERKFCGATYLFDAISDKLGLTSDLKSCFPATYKMILSIAYYLILEDSAPLFRFGKWSSLHTHPYGRDIPSQRSSELFACITEDAKMKFFQMQGRRRIEMNILPMIPVQSQVTQSNCQSSSTARTRTMILFRKSTCFSYSEKSRICRSTIVGLRVTYQM